MLVKILGAIDIFAGLILLFGAGMNLPATFLIILGIILIAKSFLGFLKDFASWIDFLCGVTFILYSVISLPSIILIIFGVLILQKGIISFF